MSSPDDPHANDFRDLCYHMGLALATWQRVEDAHYSLFVKLLGLEDSEITSAAYYTIESFETRHKMLCNMAHFLLEPRHFKKQRTVWHELKERIKHGNVERNKIAHYAVDYDLINGREMPDGGYAFDVTPHTLRPNQRNIVSWLLGRRKEAVGHNLGVTELKGYLTEFRQIEIAIGQFRDSLIAPAASKLSSWP